LLRSREVLEEAAVSSRWDNAEIESESVARDDGRLRVTVRGDLEHERQLDERSRERGRVGRRRDQVEVAHRLPATANAARLGDLDRGRMLAQRGNQLERRRERVSEQPAGLLG